MISARTAQTITHSEEESLKENKNIFEGFKNVSQDKLANASTSYLHHSISPEDRELFQVTANVRRGHIRQSDVPISPPSGSALMPNAMSRLLLRTGHLVKFQAFERC